MFWLDQVPSTDCNLHCYWLYWVWALGWLSQSHIRIGSWDKHWKLSSDLWLKDAASLSRSVGDTVLLYSDPLKSILSFWSALSLASVWFCFYVHICNSLRRCLPLCLQAWKPEAPKGLYLPAKESESPSALPGFLVDVEVHFTLQSSEKSGSGTLCEISLKLQSYLAFPVPYPPLIFLCSLIKQIFISESALWKLP